jgi:integrase
VLEAYRKTRLKEVAPATWNSELGHFKAAFAWGLTRNPPVFDKNPWSAVKSVTKPKATIQKYVAPDQIEASQAQGDPFWINTLEFLRVTWCRGGELRRLQWKHVYWSAGHLDFVGPKEKEPKRIPLNIQVANVLNVAKQLRPPASLDSYVFPNRTGGKLSKSTLYYGIRGLGAKALVKLSPHMLRHSGITNALDRGANLYAVQNVAGHSQVTTTQRYVHTDMKAKRQAMETLDATQDKAGPRYISDDPATGDATTGS